MDYLHRIMDYPKQFRPWGQKSGMASAIPQQLIYLSIRAGSVTLTVVPPPWVLSTAMPKGTP